MKYLQSIKTKPIISFVICLFLFSCQHDEILDQKPANGTGPMNQSEILSVTNKQNDLSDNSSEESVNAGAQGSEAQLMDLILRYRAQWNSEGYSIEDYKIAKENLIPYAVKDRFHQNLLFYANKNYNQESYAFVIYKYDPRYSARVYILQVLEDCPSSIIPNKYTQADSYIDR